MRHPWLAGWLIASAAGLVAAADGPVNVGFVQPQRFADIGWPATAERNPALVALAAYLKKEGAAVLAPGQTLHIDVLDVDLAGEPRPMTGRTDDVRVLRGRADWPRIHLRYQLHSPGQPDEGGEAQLADMNYMLHARIQVSSGDPLRYEKPMLHDWLHTRFGVKSSAR